MTKKNTQPVVDSWEQAARKEDKIKLTAAKAWKEDMARKWGTANADEVALGVNAWWMARVYARDLVESIRGQTTLRAIVKRAMAIGSKLGEIQMDSKGSFASTLCYDSPDVYQEAMAHPSFGWRDLACMSSPAARKQWSSQDGAEGIERFASMLMAQNGNAHKDRQWVSSASWDFSYWMSARPQDKASACLGASMGMEKLFSSMGKSTADVLAEKMRNATHVAACIQDASLTAAIAEMSVAAKGRMKSSEEAAKAREDRKWAKQKAMSAWDDAIDAALSADQTDLFLILLSAVEKKWPGAAMTMGAQALHPQESLFERAVSCRAPACAAAMLALGMPTGLAFGKRRRTEYFPHVPKLFDLAFSDSLSKPADGNGWIPVLEAFERAALREGLLAGASAAESLAVAARAPIARSAQESRRDAEEQAFVLEQAARMATLAAESEAGIASPKKKPKALPAKRL